MSIRRSGLVLAALAAASAPIATSAEEGTPEALVDALNAVFGKHSATRASHAKGICVKGSFAPTAEAQALSKAPHFATPVALLGRYSIGGGNPKAADNAKGVRALAVRFDPEGKSSDLLAINTPMFFARDGKQMLGFLQVRAPGADGKPDAAKVKAFSDANPETGKQGAFIAARGVPASYAGLSYWGVHAFTLTNAKGQATKVKFKLVPAAGELTLSDDEAKAKGGDFLAGELEERLKAGPVAHDLLAIVGEAGDATNDPTAEWPEADRKQVKLGTITISALEPSATCDATTFDPASLQDGIAGPGDDAIFPLRSPAYAISLSRRAPD